MICQGVSVNNSKQVFISYGRDEIGDKISKELYDIIPKIEGYELVAFRDRENLKDGQLWDEGLRRQIRASFLMIVLCSEKANNSPYVRDEWNFAMGAEKRIIALTIQANTKTPIPDALMQYHSSNLDFTNPTADEWQRLTNTIVSIFEEVYIPSHVQRAMEFAEHPLPDYRKQALQSLRDNEHPQAIEALAELSKNSFLPDTRWEATYHLAYKAKDERAIEYLVNAALGRLKGHNEKRATQALFYIGTKRAFNEIANIYIQTTNLEIKQNILNDFNPPQGRIAIPSMRRCLKHEDLNRPTSKIVLLRRLAEYGDTKILDSLEDFVLQNNDKISTPNGYRDYRDMLRKYMPGYKVEDVLPIYIKVIKRGLIKHNTRTNLHIDLAREALYAVEERSDQKVLDCLEQLIEGRNLTESIVSDAYNTITRIKNKLRR